MNRIREELAALPTMDELEQVRQAAQLVERVGEVWDEAEEADRRELVQMMLQEVAVDIGQDRVVWVKPRPVFITR